VPQRRSCTAMPRPHRWLARKHPSLPGHLDPQGPSIGRPPPRRERGPPSGERRVTRRQSTQDRCAARSASSDGQRNATRLRLRQALAGLPICLPLRPQSPTEPTSCSTTTSVRECTNLLTHARPYGRTCVECLSRITGERRGWAAYERSSPIYQRECKLVCSDTPTHIRAYATPIGSVCPRTRAGADGRWREPALLGSTPGVSKVVKRAVAVPLAPARRRSVCVRHEERDLLNSYYCNS